MNLSAPDRSLALIVSVGARACALPLEHVAETMRPLPIERIAGTPQFVRGVAVIRGAPVPVVDLKALLETTDSGDRYGRFVTVKVGDRRVALAVDAVIGLRALAATQVGELPPLLRSVDAELVAAIGTTDAQLLLVLRAARIVPEEVWATLATAAEAR